MDFWLRNLPHLNSEWFYIFYTFFPINLPEMKGKSLWCLFETYHMYAYTDDMWYMSLLKEVKRNQAFI